MGKLLIGLVALIVGIVIGAIGAISLGGGAMMGAGVASGLSAGICATVEAAQQAGFLTAEQVDQVLVRAAENAKGGALPEGTEMVGSAAQCAKILGKLREGR